MTKPAVKPPEVTPEVKPTTVDDVKVAAPDPKPEPTEAEAKVTPEPVEPKAAKKEPPKAHKVAHVTAKKPKPSKAETRSGDNPAEPKPEEKPWNADSPFMPVRTDKH